MLSILLHLLLSLALQAEPAPLVKIHTFPAEGLGHQPEVGRLDPSDVIRIGGRYLVFYSKIRRREPLFPDSLRGMIWYATSEDGGLRWTERGVALQRGKGGRFDARGVSGPTVALEADGAVLLFYTGVGPTLNIRLESPAKVHRTHIGAARLHFDEMGELFGVERLNGGDPVLEPPQRKTHRFDSLRVEAPSVLRHDGRLFLYYRGRAFPEDQNRSSMGLATCLEPDQPFLRQYDGWPVLPSAEDLCLLPYRGGIVALQTQSPRMLWWASDGVHFAPTIARVEGRLNDPGVYRRAEGFLDAATEGAEGKIWGLHVARVAPEPYLERFEIELPDGIPAPPVTTVPAPGDERRAETEGWLGGRTWLDQHLDIMRIGPERPKHCVFLGDSIAQGWGGRGRNVTAPGTAAWESHWGMWDFANYGISGDRTQQVLWRIDHGAFLRGRNKMVVLAMGTDSLGHDSPEEIAAGVAVIINRLHRVLPRANVLLMAIFPWGEDPDDEKRVLVRETNERLAELDDVPMVTWLDLTSTFLDESGRAHGELYTPDFRHLSPAGYEAWATALDPVLIRLWYWPFEPEPEPESPTGEEENHDGGPAD